MQPIAPGFAICREVETESPVLVRLTGFVEMVQVYQRLAHGGKPVFVIGKHCVLALNFRSSARADPRRELARVQANRRRYHSPLHPLQALDTTREQRGAFLFGRHRCALECNIVQMSALAKGIPSAGVCDLTAVWNAT